MLICFKKYEIVAIFTSFKATGKSRLFIKICNFLWCLQKSPWIKSCFSDFLLIFFTWSLTNLTFWAWIIFIFKITDFALVGIILQVFTFLNLFKETITELVKKFLFFLVGLECNFNTTLRSYFFFATDSCFLNSIYNANLLCIFTDFSSI